MPKYNKKQVLELAQKENVEFVNLQFTDINGIIKAVTIPRSKLGDAIDNNVWFDGSSVEGFTRIYESDMYLKLDIGTFAVIPWTKKSGATTARIICDVYKPSGDPYECDPRYILKKVLEKARKKGFIYNTGPELEFFLFNKDENGQIASLPHDQGGYFDLSTDMAAEVRKDMTIALTAFGIDVETLHHEVAPGQHEIDFKYADALTTADNAVTFRYTLKAIAQIYDLYATFMPKPIAGINGSGMHVHQSLFDLKTGRNAFYDPKDYYKLSQKARYFIGGQLKHVQSMTAVLDPLVNSYKRLVPGYEAPVYISWAWTNRSALMRIPRVTPGAEKAVRCELRSPDPSCNPYLAFAVMLTAGLDGIENKIKPPEPIEENLYEFTEFDLVNRKVSTLPENLRKAVKTLKTNKLICDVLGEELLKKFCDSRMSEWDEYKMYVTSWERERYLDVY